MKHFRRLALLLFFLSIVSGCGKTLKEEGGEAMNTKDIYNSGANNSRVINSGVNNSGITVSEPLKPLADGEYITDIYTDKSAYKPNDPVNVYLNIKNTGTDVLNGSIKVMIKQLGSEVTDQQEQITLSAGEEKVIDLTFSMPEQDYMGYAVEAYLYDKDILLDLEMTAVDISSDWNVFPRYGYLTDMKDRSEEESRKVLERLQKHHINGLFYYDVIDRHDKPLAGTVEEPDAAWSTLALKQASQKTVMDMIEIGHEYNMKSFVYSLIFGAYDNYEELGINKEWALYKDISHNNQDAHDLSSLGWETNKLWLFNPADKGWQDYYLKVHKDLLSVYPYDGIQVDSLGDRGKLYDYDGNPVKLNETYPELLNRLSTELDTRVIFNPVSGYGMSQQLKEVNCDILYMEVWPGDHTSYLSLKTTLDSLYRSTKGEKGTVIAAYMDYKKRTSNGGSFNTPGVNFTNAVLLAAGGSHLELGDTGMLSSEYYPGDTLKINGLLEKDLRNYYSFEVAYENFLRGPGLEDKAVKTYAEDKLTSNSSEKGRIWSFTKVKDNNTEIIHFINLSDAKHTEWVDSMGTQYEPKELTNIAVKHYITTEPVMVGAASPDYMEGIFIPLDFKIGSDDGGKYVTFQIPSLKYWTMVVIQ